MKRFQIAYCFVDSKGEIEKTPQGHDNVYVAVISARNKDEALKEFYETESFIVRPEILDVVDLGENKLFN